MSRPTKIFSEGDNAQTLLTIAQGELRNWGYEVSEVTTEYEPNWGEKFLMIEVKTNGGG